MLEQPKACSSFRSRVLHTGPCPNQCWLCFAGSEWDCRPGEMSILAQIWFSCLAGCVLLSCYKPWNTQELLCHHLSLLSGWKHDCIFLMTRVQILGSPVFICFIVIFIQMQKNRTFHNLLFTAQWNHVPAIVVCTVCFPHFQHRVRITFHGCVAANRRMKSEIQNECFFNTSSSQLWLKLQRCVETFHLISHYFSQVLFYFILLFFYKKGILFEALKTDVEDDNMSRRK